MDEVSFNFMLDGDQWSCHLPGLDNLAEDPVGFGPDKKSALQHLLEQLGDDLT